MGAFVILCSRDGKLVSHDKTALAQIINYNNNDFCFPLPYVVYQGPGAGSNLLARPRREKTMLPRY